MPVSYDFGSQFGTPLNPGILRHRITWQHRVATSQDAMGEDLPASEAIWHDVITSPASVQPLTGREYEQAQQRWAEAQYTITQHSVTGLRREMRGLWWHRGEARYLDILDIQEPGLGQVQVIIARDFQG